MHLLEFTLKQHTPIIHFQHDQDGATLRATEVKPKLDRYIIEKFGGKDKMEKSWFKNFEKGSLDYKMRIVANGASSLYWISSNPNSLDKKLRDGTIKKGKDHERISNAKTENSTYLNKTQYFADNQFFDKPKLEWKNIRKGIKHDTISLLFTFFNSSLGKAIEDNLSAFFCLHNFGTRQTKGFGCFLPSKIKEAEVESFLVNDEKITGVFKIFSTLSSSFKLQEIAAKYSLLKMGRGVNAGGYAKSKLWEYLCADGKVSWEKRKIKVHVLEKDSLLFNKIYSDTKPLRLSPLGTTKENYENDTPHYYIRALLGLAEQYEFLLSNEYGKVDFGNKLVAKVADELATNQDQFLKKLSIERFQSPIRFVVTENNIFLVTYKIANELFEYLNPNTQKIEQRKFQFTINKLAKGTNTFSLTIPSGFDLADFVKKSNLFGNNLKVIVK